MSVVMRDYNFGGIRLSRNDIDRTTRSADGRTAGLDVAAIPQFHNDSSERTEATEIIFLGGLCAMLCCTPCPRRQTAPRVLDELNPSIIQLAYRSIISCHLPFSVPALPTQLLLLLFCCTSYSFYKRFLLFTRALPLVVIAITTCSVYQSVRQSNHLNFIPKFRTQIKKLYK